MTDQMEKLFVDYERRMGKEGNKYGALADDNVSIHQEGGEEPPESPSSSSISSSSLHFHNSDSHKKDASKKPFSKLDVKLNLLMFNGEDNVYNINNWIR